MKLLLLALLVIPAAYGMDMLRHRLNCFATKFYYDLPCENISWNVNDVVNGKTMFDLISLTGRIDLDFVDFMRQRGARSADELETPNENLRPLVRAARLLSHIAPAQTS